MSLSVGGGLLQSGGSWSHPAAALRCCRHGRAGVPCLSPFILLPWVLHSVALDVAALFCGFFFGSQLFHLFLLPGSTALGLLGSPFLQMATSCSAPVCRELWLFTAAWHRKARS